jgi:formylglycine-generating enzyme required for sulfatase activity
MGSPASEPDRHSDEAPQRRVSISRAFAVGRMEISVEQFSAFADETAYGAGSMCYTYEGGKWEHRQGRSFRGPGFALTGSHPAGCLNWHDAQAYVAWLSSKTGKQYRLLTEAEWEYVARAGTTTPFWWGASISPSQANYDGNSGYSGGATGEFRGRSVPVSSFAPNPWGLYQVHGNVWEWVEDCRQETYRGAPTDGSASITGDCRRRALRGGSWAFSPGLLRSAARSHFSGPADLRGANVGLRVARTLAR